jgi:hypothetical protein
MWNPHAGADIDFALREAVSGHAASANACEKSAKWNPDRFAGPGTVRHRESRLAIGCRHLQDVEHGCLSLRAVDLERLACIAWHTSQGTNLILRLVFFKVEPTPAR